MSTLIAVPSVSPGGLEAALMPHFGHCDVFTLVEMDENGIKNVSTLPNMPHEHGGCLAPVQYLAGKGVAVMLAGGMGMRPLQAFQQNGIKVLFAGTDGTVGQAVKGFSEGKLAEFGDNGLCKGSCGGHH